MKRILIPFLFLFALLIGTGKPAPILGQGSVPEYQFQAIWGLPLEQDGLLRPVDIAQDENGDIYLADANRNQVMVFSTDGEFRRAIGEAGNGPGQLYRPRSVAVHDGEVYVADSRNARIQVFSKNGDFLRTIGEFKKWPGGSTGLQLPLLVRVNANDQVFVLNRATTADNDPAYRIMEYTKDGQFIQGKLADGRFDLYTLGPDGTAYVMTHYGRLYVTPIEGEAQMYDLRGDDGELDSVAALFATENTLWIYDNFNHPRLLEYSQEAVWQRTITLEENMPPENTLAAPKVTGILINGDGVRLVNDNAQVSFFDLEGRLLQTWGQRGARTPGMFDHPDRLAAAPDGSLYVLERARGRIQHLDAQGETISVIDNSTLEGLHMWDPQDIAVDGWGRLYVLEGGRTPTVLRFRNDVFEKRLSDLSPRNWPLGQGNESASRIDILGDALLSYSLGPVLSEFDLDGTYLNDSRFWGTYGGGDISQSIDGKVYLLEPVKFHVIQVDFVKHRKTSWGKLGLKDGQFFRPSSVLADNMGRIFVLDTDNGDFDFSLTYTPFEELPYSSRVQAFDPDGNFLASWGGFGSDEGHFINPQAIEMLADGRLVVADTDNNRLQVFSPHPPLSSPPPFPKPRHFNPPLDPVAAEWSPYAPLEGVDYPRQLEVRKKANGALVIYATAGYTGRVFASDDGAETWQELPTPSGPVRNIILAGQHTIIIEVKKPDSFYRSDDDGQTWKPIFTQFWGWSNWLIDILPSPNFDEDRTLYLSGLNLGVYRSTDAGESWQSVGLDQHQVFLQDVSVDEQGNRHLLVVDRSRWSNTANSALLLSADGGVTWKEIGYDFDMARFSTTFAADHTLFGIKDGKLYRSQNKGETWEKVELAGISNPSYVNRLLVAPDFQDTRTLIVVGYANAYITSDGGEHWQPIPPSDMTFAPDYRERPTIFRVYFSYWQSLIGRSDDGGMNWRSVGNSIPRGPIGALASPDATAAGPKWAAPSYLLLAGSRNNPWHLVESFPFTGIGSFNYSELELSPTFPHDGIAMAGRAITRDSGQSWEFLGDAFDGLIPYAIAFAPDFAQSRTMLAAGTPYDWGKHPSRLWISEDGGSDWRRVYLPDQLPIIIFDIAFDANWTQNRTVYLAMENGVARSTDGGESWELPSDALLRTNVVGLVSRQEGNGSRLYAATSTAGVFVSDDQGGTWREFNQRLPQGHVCAFAGNDDFLVAGLCDGSIFVRPAYDVWHPIGTSLGVRPNDILIFQNNDSVTLIVSTNNDVYTTTFSTPIPPILDQNLWIPYVR